MPVGMRLTDAALGQAGRQLVEAARGLRDGTAQRPPAPETLGALSSEIDDFLRGLCVARAALADAAQTGARSVAALMADSGRLDAAIARELPVGLALPGDTA